MTLVHDKLPATWRQALVHSSFRPAQTLTASLVIIIIIIIIIITIIINCNWVVTRWQWLFYMYTKHEIGY